MNRKKKASSRRLAGLLGLAALVGGFVLLIPSLRADDAGTGSAQPARAVRLSFVEGDVRQYQGGQQMGDQAVANTPLFEGARIDTGNDGRAEIQFEDGSVVRVSPQSSVTLSVLKGLSANAERDAEIVLNSGLGYFELQGESDSNHMKVRFDSTEVTAGGFTVLRINLDKAPGEVAVFSGNAHIEGAAIPTLDLHGGESVALNATDPDNYNLAETIEPDSWDAWNSDRDQEISSAAADRTTATQNQPDSSNPAWSDLDANGNWYNVPDQGYVWSPYDASNPGWDPYADGYWMNSPGYGYFWISGYPWGYLPYQCGAWNFYPTFGWGWAPGFCSPWWGGHGGWVINIGFPPPRYRFPIRPRPRNPRPMGHEPTPMPLIAVNRRSLTPGNGSMPGNMMPAPRDKTGAVMIAGNRVQPLRPIQQPRLPYNRAVPVFTTRPAPNPPSVTGNPRVFEGSGAPSAIPRAVGVPSRPVPPSTIYTPAPQPRTAPVYTPPPSAPPRPVGAPAPPSHSAPPPSAPAHFSGGGGSSHSSGGGGGGGVHVSSGSHR